MTVRTKLSVLGHEKVCPKLTVFMLEELCLNFNFSDMNGCVQIAIFKHKGSCLNCNFSSMNVCVRIAS